MADLKEQTERAEAVEPENAAQAHGKPVVPLLIHSDYRLYGWSKAKVDGFCRAAAKIGSRVVILHDPREAMRPGQYRFLIVLGSDLGWLRETVALLRPSGVRVLLLSEINLEDGVSHIYFDQKAIIEQSLALLRARGRFSPAMFGVMRDDVSDEQKAASFAALVDGDRVFRIADSAGGAFDRFFARRGEFDSVICANDIVAVYLIQRLREQGVRVPDDLMVIGNGNLQIAACVAPSLTTVAYDDRTLAEVALQVCTRFDRFETLREVSVRLTGALVERESTGGSFASAAWETDRSHSAYAEAGAVSCPDLQPICALDRLLSSCTPVVRQILRRLDEGKTYEEIAADAVLSPDTVKYHVKRLYKQLGLHRRDELQRLIRDYRVRL